MKIATVEITWCGSCPHHLQIVGDDPVCAKVKGDGWAGQRRIIAETLPFTFPIWRPLPDAPEAKASA